MTNEAQISNEAELVVKDPVQVEDVIYDKAAIDAAAEAKADAVKADEVKQESEVKTEGNQEAEVAKDKDQSHDLELVAPADSLLAEKDIEQVKAYAKEHNLSKEAAQKLVDDKQSALVQFKERQSAELKAQTQEWLKLAEVDTEIGGKDFSSNIQSAKRVLDKYGTPGLRKALDMSGLGNNPDVIKTFFRISKLMDNDKLIVAPKNAAAEERSLEDIFYGTQA